MPAELQNEIAPLVPFRAMPSLISEGMERLRILHVMARLGTGGTEHGVLKVVDGLGHDRFEHRFCAVRGLDPGFGSHMGLAAQAYSVGTSKPGQQFPLLRLVRIMRQFRPHIVHSRNFGALDAVAAARLAGVPVTIHSEHGYELDILTGLPFRRRILYRTLLPMADAVFTVSNDLRIFHSRQSQLPLDSFRVLYNGVDTDRFSSQPIERANIRKQLGVPASRLVLGSVGRLVPLKDHGTLLKAAELILRRGRDIHVVLVGGGSELPKLKAYVEGSTELAGRVSFTGASEDIPGLLNSMDIFVLPSISEGMSNTVLEAMASGLPVVVTRAGGNPELVDEGRNGLFFPPGDAVMLADLLDGLANAPDQRRALGDAGRHRVLDEFSLPAMVHRYRELYFELAARRGTVRGE